MSQLILDDQLSSSEVLRPLEKWITAQRLRDLRPDELILDDRIPEILLTLRQPTFVTIDHGFWNKRLCNPNYCVLYFSLRDDQQELLPDLLRALFRRPEFRTRVSRMGKVACVGLTSVDFWEFKKSKLTRIESIDD